MPAGLPDWYKYVKSDIFAQSIDNLNININAQSLTEVIQFRRLGSVKRDTGAWAASSGETVTFLEVLGEGTLYYYMLQVDAATDSELVGMWAKIDDDWIIPIYYFEDWYGWGFDKNTAPFRLTKYAADGEIVGIFCPYTPLTFKSKLEVGLRNASAGSQTGYRWIIYSVL